MILSLPSLEPVRYFNWVSKKLNGENILKWIGSVDTIYHWQEMYNIRVTTLANKLSVSFNDIRSAFLLNHRYKDLQCEDGTHPNKSGYELIYKTIADQY
jgi:acyl-CoA thioesterase-1